MTDSHRSSGNLHPLRYLTEWPRNNARNVTVTTYVRTHTGNVFFIDRIHTKRIVTCLAMRNAGTNDMFFLVGGVR